MSHDNRKLINTFFSFSVGTWLTILVGLVSTPVITRLVSPEELGVFSMFFLVMNVMTLVVMFGTDQSFIRFFYEENPSNRISLLRSSIMLVLLFFIPVCLGMLLFRDWISLYIFDSVRPLYIILLITAVASNVLFKYALMVLRMQQKGGWYSTVQVLNKVSNFLFFIVLILFMTSDILPLMFAVLFGLIVAAASGIFKERKFWFGKTDPEAGHMVNSKKDILRYSAPLVMTNIVYWLFQSFDRIAIKEFAGFEELGVYAGAIRIVGLAVVLETAFTTFWVPVSFERYEKNPEDKGFFTKIHRLVSLFMLSVGLFTMMFRHLIVYLLGPEYREALMILPFLMFIPVFYTISETTVKGIAFAKKTMWHLVIALIVSAVNICGNILLVPVLGARGAAISTGLSYILFFILRTVFSRRYYPVDYQLKKLSLQIGGIVVYAGFLTFSENLYIDLTGGLVMIVLIYTGFKSEIRQLLTGSLNELFRQMKIKKS